MSGIKRYTFKCSSVEYIHTYTVYTGCILGSTYTWVLNTRKRATTKKKPLWCFHFKPNPNILLLVQRGWHALRQSLLVSTFAYINPLSFSPSSFPVSTHITRTLTDSNSDLNSTLLSWTTFCFQWNSPLSNTTLIFAIRFFSFDSNGPCIICFCCNLQHQHFKYIKYIISSNFMTHKEWRKCTCFRMCFK